MTRVALNKVIHTAVSAPGAGKTQSLISQIPSLLSAGRSIVIALPTIKLTDSFTSRIPAGVPYRVVNSITCDHVGSALQSALKQKAVHLVITTHQSVFAVEPSLLSDWLLIVDELPVVADFPAFPFEPSELAQLLINAEERDGRLYIRDGCTEAIETSLETFKAVSAGAARTSMLSKEGAQIYECLKDGNPVFIDAEMSNGNRYVRSVVESNCWSTFAAAEEVHILAANVGGSLFDTFAQVHEFTFANSIFTPAFEGYTSEITIYPVMPMGRIYSKTAVTLAQASTDQQMPGEHLVIDVILKTALQQTTGTPLLFNNKWASFRWLPKEAVYRCSIDSRGLNEYQGETDAILLFGGNPSPSDEQGLEFLAEKYGRDFRQGFIVSRLLEPSLQAATRTAVRDRCNTKPIQLIVQDGRVADYLVSTHMPHAVIDWSLSDLIPVAQDRRTVQDPRKSKAFELFAGGITKNAEVSARTGAHRNSIGKWKKEWQMSLVA
ncbi:hypothetical protein ACSC9T_21725 [Pseudomonas putida]|uniref:hypothetical protein n=1 Tax=Pseudomonas putida TaxID=303 RepID=UPI003F4AEF75